MTKKLIISIFLGLFFLGVLQVGARGEASLNSANLPLDSLYYLYLEKLTGLGFLRVTPGAKPYTRMQIAKWILDVKAAIVDSERELSPYVQTLIAELETEFSKELAIIQGAEEKNQIEFRRLAWSTAYYDGQTLSQSYTKSSYQPLNINNNGDQLALKFNSRVSFNLEGEINDLLLVSLTPELSYNEEDQYQLNLESGYFKTGFSNLSLQFGKESMWWGHGRRGSLILSNNSRPQLMMKIANLEPFSLNGWFSLLNEMNTTFFISEPDRYRNDVAETSFIGGRFDFSPTKDLTFAVVLTSIVGGKGRSVGWDDLDDFLLGRNAGTTDAERWDSIAGFDFAWRLPKINNLILYGEIYGEDQAGSLPPLPSKIAGVWGIYFPRLSVDGSWDLLVEGATTSDAWYRHWVYTDGYVFRDQIIGDAMGCDSGRWLLRLNHYWTDGTQVAFNYESLVMNRSAADSKTLHSLWITGRTKICPDVALISTIGWSVTKQSEDSKSDYLLELILAKLF